jgi:heterodisulfide reductase subunit C
MAKVSTKLLDEIGQSERFNATACMNCGICAAVCPMETELLPRKLFRYVVLGLEEKVLENTETIFSCLLCRMCHEDCTADVNIAENVRFLRGYINRKVYKI